MQHSFRSSDVLSVSEEHSPPNEMTTSTLHLDSSDDDIDDNEIESKNKYTDSSLNLYWSDDDIDDNEIESRNGYTDSSLHLVSSDDDIDDNEIESRNGYTDSSLHLDSSDDDIDDNEIESRNRYTDSCAPQRKLFMKVHHEVLEEVPLAAGVPNYIIAPINPRAELYRGGLPKEQSYVANVASLLSGLRRVRAHREFATLHDADLDKDQEGKAHIELSGMLSERTSTSSGATSSLVSESELITTASETHVVIPTAPNTNRPKGAFRYLKTIRSSLKR